MVKEEGLDQLGLRMREHWHPARQSDKKYEKIPANWHMNQYIADARRNATNWFTCDSLDHFRPAMLGGCSNPNCWNALTDDDECLVW